MKNTMQEIPYTNDNTLPASVIHTDGHKVHNGPRFPYVFLRKGVVYHVKEEFRKGVLHQGDRVGDFVLRPGNVFTVTETGSLSDLVRISFIQTA